MVTVLCWLYYYYYYYYYCYNQSEFLILTWIWTEGQRNLGFLFKGEEIFLLSTAF